MTPRQARVLGLLLEYFGGDPDNFSADDDGSVELRGWGRLDLEDVRLLMAHVAALQRENARLRKALVEHGEHRPGCHVEWRAVCTCGLDDALHGQAAQGKE